MSAPGVIDVMTDFTGLNVRPEQVYLTNEQDTTTFPHASESGGASRKLIDAPDTPRPMDPQHRGGNLPGIARAWYPLLCGNF
jgi:hypothetical protein